MSTSRTASMVELAIHVDNDRRLVIDCPTCKRTIWNGSTCSHGAVPVPTKQDADDAPKGDFKEKRNKGGTKDR